VLLALPLIALGGYAIIAGRRRLLSRALDQDGRERDRLFGDEHRTSVAVAAHQP
jgi:hypothetical protein